MTTYQSGFTIVFGGPDFQPESFLHESDLEPNVVMHRGDLMSDGRAAEESWLEWYDIHKTTYLDAKREALYFLLDQQKELARLSSFPGVDFRTLNFFGDANSCSMTLSPEDTALLHELGIQVSVSVCS